MHVWCFIKIYVDIPSLQNRVGPYSPMRDQPLYFGGPMNTDVVLHLFHPRKLLTPENWDVNEGEGRVKTMLFQRFEDAKVAPGLYCSFVTPTVLSSLSLQLTLGEANPNQVIMMKGLMGWVGRDIREECEKNHWIVVSSEGSPGALLYNTPPPLFQAESPTTGTTTSAEQKPAQQSMVELWERVMVTLGGEYVDWARVAFRHFSH